MMRWLKDKKREKRSNSTSNAEEGKEEDDYGFEKEKQASKSPPSRRQLPPTPAAPEEKSPHIYEEIPDLPLCCTPESEKTLLHNKFNKGKVSGRKSPQNRKSQSNQGNKYDQAGDINPYMVVPVDKDVRQTPTDFHRNGTPEVHCDVIVKDTHCEILMTRKPKVSAFRLDTTAFSGGGSGMESNGGTSGVRNNTHFCSRDRRASVDVHSSGKPAAFSYSAFFGSSRTTASGTQSSQSMSSFQEVQGQESQGNCNTSASGVIPYACASNFIPRTKLTFHPLCGKDPRKEAFGSDCSDDSQTVNMCRIRDDAASSGTNGISYSSIQEACNTSKSVTYTSVVEQNTSGASVVRKFESHSEKQPCYLYGDSQNSFMNTYGDSNISRGGIIRPASPSNSSSCTYASVNFPVEPKVYNTIIPDLIPPRNSAMDSDVIYASVQETFDSQNIPQNNANDTQVKNGGGFDRTAYGGAYARHPTQFNSGYVRDLNQSVPKGVHCSTDEGDISPPPSIMSSEAHYRRRSLDLDFCSCSDEHSSSCGCADSKNGQDDDVSSVAGAASIGPSSCKGCGRLIRQITYSESFSDETYEHAYSSRMLIRSGRRSNASELPFRETLTTEFQSTSNTRSPDFLMAMSRDDTWALSRSDDTLPPAYGACDDNGFVSNYGETMSLKRRDSDMSAYRIFRDSKGLSVGSVSSPKHFMRQNTSPVSSDTSMFCSLRATVSTSSFFSTRRQGILDQMETLPQTEESTIPKIESLNSASSVSNTALELRAFPKAPSFSEPATFSQVPLSLESQVKETNLENIKATLQFPGQSDSKPNTFSGIFSKFGRSKSSKTQKSDSSEPCLSNSLATDQMNEHENRQGDIASKEDSGDKNVKKLSKFFQRLSSKECVRPTNNSTQVCFRVEAGDEPEPTVSSSKMNKPATSSQLFSDEGGKEKTDLKNKPLSRHSDVALSTWDTSDCQASGQMMHKVVSQTKLLSLCSPEIHTLTAIASDVQRETTRGACTGAFDAMAVGKPQANTDSGDTCYEYDISTSSEGEQASYDYFLSKVKKTLNLEREVQHFADSGTFRKRLLCKSCKKDEQLSTVETVEAGASGSSYWFCPHLSAKFGDLRAILADLVVDQRAAILDCLTDYAQSPYGVRSGAVDGHQCDCGFEALTTDAESLATIYNLLSHPLNYPSGQTPSCDSDEGTMADNSCESADEAIDVNKSSCATRAENIENEHQAPFRPRKKEKKDKKGMAHPGETFSKETFTEKLKFTEGHSHVKDAYQTYSEIDSTTHNKHTINTSASTRRNAGKKSNANIASFVQIYSSSPSTEISCDRSDHSKCCLVSKAKHTIVTEKAIQDIYSPLPSKALSILTSRNYGPHAGASNCTCGGVGRGGFYAPLTIKATSQLTTGETSPPPPYPPPPPADLDYETVNPSSRSCDANNGGDKVHSVQTHLGHEDAQSCSGEPHQHNDGKDGGGEQRKLSSNAENKIAVPGVKEPPVESINAFINGSEAKDGLFQITKHGAPVSGQDKGSPSSIINATLKNRPRFNVEIATSDTRVMCSQGLYNTTEARERKEPKQVESSRLDVDVTAVSRAIIAQAFEPNKKAKLSRRQRLELATLDLLPETALCGDTDQNAVESSYPHADSSRPGKPKISKVVESMTKIFERREDGPQNDNRKRNRQFGAKMSTHDGGINKEASSHAAKENEKAAFSSHRETIGSESKVYREIGSTRPLSQISGNLHASAQLAAALSDAAINKRLRELRKAASSCEIQESKATSECDPEKSNSASSVGDGTVDQKPSASQTTSPTSGSPTASLSKKKTSGGKHRKLSKKSHKKRSRSRSERGRGGSSKGEKTLYYLSSDLSDIDVVEVEDWEAYAKNKAPQSPGEAASSSRPEASIYDDITSPEDRLKGTQDVEGESHQEVYALPPSSAELRSARANKQGRPSNNGGGNIGGEQSPEPSRLRKGLRTDVYRTVKNNNKLLSDVIIRNYDMQVYGNV